MMNYMKSELLKTKRTTMQKMAVLVPLLCIILAAGFCTLGGAAVIIFADITTVNHWGLLWLPALVALLAGLSIKQEKKAGQFKMIFGSPVEPGNVWVAKVVVIAGITLAATFGLWVFICVFDILIIHSTAKLISILLALLLSWVAVIWQIPVYLFLAQKINYFLLLIVSCGLSIMVAPIYSIRSDWWRNPWAWILRFQAPILKLHPNGILLNHTSELLRYDSFVQALALAVLLLDRKSVV